MFKGWDTWQFGNALFVLFTYLYYLFICIIMHYLYLKSCRLGQSVAQRHSRDHNSGGQFYLWFSRVPIFGHLLVSCLITVNDGHSHHQNFSIHVQYFLIWYNFLSVTVWSLIPAILASSPKTIVVRNIAWWRHPTENNCKLGPKKDKKKTNTSEFGPFIGAPLFTVHNDFLNLNHFPPHV